MKDLSPSDRRRLRLAVVFLRFGYANYVPASWVHAVLLLGDMEVRPPLGSVWDAAGARAQRRLARCGHLREDY